MPKRIKFPLEMKDGIKVRTIEELRQNFDAEKLLMYFVNGKLSTWISDRHYNDYLAKLQDIDSTDDDCLKEICELLEIKNINTDENIDISEIEDKNNRIKKIRQYTDDSKIIENIDSVAMSQAEFENLLLNSKDTIYLCGEKFICPQDIENIKIVGINNPEIEIRSSEVVDFEKKNVFFEGVRFDEKYHEIIEQLKYEIEHRNDKKKNPYQASSLFDIRLSDDDRKQSEKLYKMLQDGLGDIAFNVDVYTDKLYKLLTDADLYDSFDINVIGEKQRECLQKAHLDDLFYDFCTRNDI